MLEESVVRVTWVQADAHDGLLVARGIDHDHVQFGFAADTADRVVARGMDVPALKVDSVVVVGDARVSGPVVFVRDGECGAVTPIVEVAADGAVEVECRDVVE